MIGDLEDLQNRLRLTLPTRWFNETTPVLNGFLSGFASTWVSLHSFLQFIKRQVRLSTVEGDFLDLAAQDLVSDSLPRRPQETDQEYRERLLATIQRSRATRSALISAASAAGYSIKVFEAAQPNDTGAYNVFDRLAWNVKGGWGSLQMPLECLVVASPQVPSYEAELYKNLASVGPAGGAIWLLINESV